MKWVKRCLVMLVGGTVLLLGIALIVLPGPAFVVIPLGLAILAIEFAWARRWLRSARAILPFGHGRDGFRRNRISLNSVRRRFEFLFRQTRRVLGRKKAISRL